MESETGIRPLTFPSHLLDHVPSHLDTLFQTLWELQQVHQMQPNYLELHTRLHTLTARLMHIIMSLSPELQEYIVLPFSSQKDTPDWLHTRLSNDIMQLEDEYIQSAKRQISISSSFNRKKKRRLGLFRSTENQEGGQNTINSHEEKLFQSLQTQVSVHDGFVLQALDIFKENKRQFEKSIFEPYEEVDDDDDEEEDDDDIEMNITSEKDAEDRDLKDIERKSTPTSKSIKKNEEQVYLMELAKNDEKFFKKQEIQEVEDEEDDEDVRDVEDEDEDEDEDEEDEAVESKELESNKRKERWTLAHLPDPVKYKSQLSEAVRFLHSGPVKL